MSLISGIYEVAAFQKKVMGYGWLKDNSYWTEIDADKTKADSHSELLTEVERLIKNFEQEELTKLR